MMAKVKPTWLIPLTGLFIAVDLVFVCLHLALEWGYLHGLKFSLVEEWSYSEWFQYFKFFWIAVMFGLLYAQQKKLVYFTGAAIFTYLLLDDSLRIHENVGKLIVLSQGWEPYWTTHLNLRNQDWGELAVSVVAGGAFLTMLALAYWRGDSASRRVCVHLVLWIAVLGFFGVFVDMLSIAVGESDLTVLLLDISEDGGEMIVASLIVFYSTRLLVLKGPGNLSSDDRPKAGKEADEPA